MIYETLTLSKYDKVCIAKTDSEHSYNLYVNVLIENSNLNAFNLISVIHDGKEFNLEGNFIVLPSAKHLLQFHFNDSNNIYLKIKDTQNVFHYYNLKVFSVKL